MRTEVRWISHPWVDLLVGCGGWSAPLLVASYFVRGGSAQDWAAIFYSLALVCNYPHYMATLHRAYARREDRSAHRLFTHGITALLVLAGFAAHVHLDLLTWLFTAYVMWSPWHYTGQNYGLLMMILRRNGVDVTPGLRQALRASFVASYVMLLAAFNEGASADPLIQSLGLPVAITTPIQVLAGGMFGVVGVAALAHLARSAGLRALAAPLTLYSTQALWFVVPIGVSWVAGVATPQTRYSTGMLAVMHSAQYLWVTRYFARRDAIGRGEAAQWSDRRYWTILIAGGIALFLPVPWLASYAAHVDFTASMLIVTAIVNLHHFVIDGVVWKLRDPRVSRALIGDAAAPPAAARLSVREAWALWLRRPSARATMVVALAALALIDQWRYRLALRTSDRQALETARALNPHDTSIHLQLAGTAERAGDHRSAEASLRTAMRVGPHNPSPAHALLRLLAETGRYAEAYAQAQAILARWPDDVDTLVNAGVLADRLSDRPAAEHWWRRALEHDPSLQHVQLYLAELLKAAGRLAESAVYYRAYLEETVRLDEKHRPEPRHVALVALNYGDALAATGRPDLARSQWGLAASIARNARLDDVLALAIERLPAR
jgi:Tfp pilus assembly protein PilF